MICGPIWMLSREAELEATENNIVREDSLASVRNAVLPNQVID